MVLKYISLFSGIGGFEIAIQRLHPRAVCIGYSEIDPKAISVYNKNFPKHTNLGDVTKINMDTLSATIKRAGGCDLLVAGFPCNDLSSINTHGKGLEGPQSKLFYDLLEIVKLVFFLNKNVNVVIENNASMSNKWRDTVTNNLKSILPNVFITKINAGDIVVQTRRRYFWTTKHVPSAEEGKVQKWADVLEPLTSSSLTCDDYPYNNIVKYHNGIIKTNDSSINIYVKAVKTNKTMYKFTSVSGKGQSSRWSKYPLFSDTSHEGARPILAKAIQCVLLDRRGCPHGQFRVRRFAVKELARLFTFDDDHLPAGTSVNAAYVLFGKAVVVKVVEHVLKHVLK